MDKVQDQLETTSASGHWVIDNTHSQSAALIENPHTRRFLDAIKDEIKTANGSFQDNTEISFEDSTQKHHDLNIDEISLDIFHPKFSIINGREYSKATQRWVGFVTGINTRSNEFEAKLVDKSKGGTDEYVVFDLDEVSPDDNDLLRVGAIFYWSVGHEMKNGQQKNESILKFKREVGFSDADIIRAFDIGHDLLKGIDWED